MQVYKSIVLFNEQFAMPSDVCSGMIDANIV